MSAPLILLVDDELSIQQATATLLRSRGYAVTVAGTGQQALDCFDRERPSLVILDLGLPDLDGATVCERLRSRTDVPILVLSVRNDERSKVQALDAGAGDYVMKPFGPEELLTRVRAGLRRAGGTPHELHGRVERGDLTIDFDRRRVYRHGDEIRLTPYESELLTLLASQAGRGPDTPHDFQTHLGHQRRWTTGAPSSAGRSAPEEAGTRSRPSALYPDRTVGRISVRTGIPRAVTTRFLQGASS